MFNQASEVGLFVPFYPEHLFFFILLSP